MDDIFDAVGYIVRVLNDRGLTFPGENNKSGFRSMKFD